MEVPPLNEGWRAWVYVRPLLDGPGHAETREAWTLSRRGARYDSQLVRYVLRRVELSPWHLQPEWAGDLDLAMEQHPVPDEQRVVESEGDVVATLQEWGAAPEALRSPLDVEYPHPPPAWSGGSPPLLGPPAPN